MAKLILFYNVYVCIRVHVLGCHGAQKTRVFYPLELAFVSHMGAKNKIQTLLTVEPSFQPLILFYFDRRKRSI